MTTLSYGIIYRIINKTTGKSYIGKTKSHYGKNVFGAERRFKQHIASAYSYSKVNSSPLFYKAIRKYGRDDFTMEVLLQCDMSKVDMFEISMIRQYMACNRTFGYNIAAGGKGRSVVETTEEIRSKISKAQTDEILNIKKIEKEGVVIGYRVRRRQNGKVYGKEFGSVKNTPEKNLELANNFLDQVKKGVITSFPYNKKTDLPKCITSCDNGYKVHVMKNKVKYTKSFTNSSIPDEAKLQYAIEWIKIIKEGLMYESQYDIDTSRPPDMKNITISKNKKSEQTGYRVKIIYKGKTYNKGYESLSISMEQKHKMAIEWRDNMLQLLRKNEQEDSSKEDRDNPPPSSL